MQITIFKTDMLWNQLIYTSCTWLYWCKLSRSYPSLTTASGTVSIVTADGRIIVVCLQTEWLINHITVTGNMHALLPPGTVP